MKYCLLLLTLFCGTVQAEGLYLTLGAGWNESYFSETDDWNDGGGTGAFISLSYQWDKQWWCLNCMPSINYAHVSQWDVGPPWNDDFEDSVDHLGFAGTWKLF